MSSPNITNANEKNLIKTELLNSSIDTTNDSLQRLQFLQIQYDEMLQVSSHLLKEKEKLEAKNYQLLDAISVLLENEKEDTKTRALMKREIHDLKKQLRASKDELQDALTNFDASHGTEDEFQDPMKSNRSLKTNFLHQYVSQQIGNSFRIDGISRRNRYKNIQGAFAKEKLSNGNKNIFMNKQVNSQSKEEVIPLAENHSVKLSNDNEKNEGNRSAKAA